MSLLDTASLIVTPNAYKEGKLYSVIPSDGSGDLSVTRATTATRVNSAGLVELVPYNLLTYSEQLDNSNWVKGDATISANSAIAPNGKNTADKFIANSNNTAHFFYQSVPTGSCTFSIYAKAAEETVFSMWLNDFSKNAVFDLSTGTVVLSNVSSANITDVGNGWYRCEAYDTTSTSFVGVFGRNATAYIGNGVNGMFFWGAQAVEGTTAKPYQRTETRLNIPRLDYSNGSCPSLLVEPQRTNLCTYSEDFTNVVWGKFLTTITPNTTISPSGIQNADTFETSSNSSGVLFINSFVTSGDKTFSIYAKKGSNDILDMGFTDVTDFTARFNLSSGTLVSQTSGLTSTITSVGNDWYRLTVSKNISALGSIFLINLTPSINKTMFLWGAQLEAGAYPTSYIPTTSASVTRNADAISKTGISSLIGQTEGTIFWEGQVNGFGLYPQLFDLNAGGNKYIQIYNDIISGNPTIGIYVQNVSLLLNNPNIATIAFNTNFKFALGYKANDYVVYLNGTQVFSNTTIGVPPTSNFGLGDVEQTASTSKKNVKATAIWKTRLTNAQLAQLTTI
jgi:hypothetical protein